MRHDDVWRAIDTLAAEHGLSPSGLARKAGLDPTSFNMSKRGTADGRNRWPSTESLSKVLNATGAGLADFTALVMGARAMPESRSRPRTTVPVFLTMAAILRAPAGTRWNCRRPETPTPTR
jgi:phage repressor protein C with HTH and peptisase S24 domain